MSGNSTVAELLRQSRERQNGGANPAPGSSDELETDDYLAYAKLRGARSVALMLELRRETGESEAFDYGWLARARFDPSTGIELRVANVAVLIKGKNLRPLYEEILRHRVTWVRETSEPGSAARDPEATIVTLIDIEANHG